MPNPTPNTKLTVTLFFDVPGENPGDTFDTVEEAHVVDYVCLVSGETFGPPPLIAPTKDKHGNQLPQARPGQEVLFINTKFTPRWKIKRNLT